MQCPFSKLDDSESIQIFTKPPVGETIFGDHEYRRELVRFSTSGHFVNDQKDRITYDGAYVAATYCDYDGIRRRFNKVVSLPDNKSDNAARVRRLQEFCRPCRTLDVGSGLGVFPWALAQAGWMVTALDPDPVASRHLRELGLDTVCSVFGEAELPAEFDLLTFNKVLEHVRDPAAMLAKAKTLLAPNGAVYFEVPDGEMALTVGADRQEFFTDHWHAFSFKSAAWLAEVAGFTPQSVERLQEPSGKFTLRVFCR